MATHMEQLKDIDNAQTLSAGEVTQFGREGWVGPFPLISADHADHLSHLRRSLEHRLCVSPAEAIQYKEGAVNQKVWSKSLHEISGGFFDIAHHPAIVDRVRALLGPNLLVWGVSTTHIPSGGGHRWHVDVEHVRWRGVSIFMGLKNLTFRSSLKLVTMSQRFRVKPQDVGIRSDAEAIQYCRRMDPGCELKIVNPGVGGFFIFDGTIWHGSRNDEMFERDALIIQYCTPEQRVQIPLSWNEPMQWHFERPACALVAGSDHYGHNRLIGRPNEYL